MCVNTINKFVIVEEKMKDIKELTTGVEVSLIRTLICEGIRKFWDCSFDFIGRFQINRRSLSHVPRIFYKKAK